MSLQSPTDAMPWVGLYVAVASLICTLAMAADAFQGFRQRKLWFPCRFFTINAASITLMAIAMKLPVDLSDDNILEPYRHEVYVMGTKLLSIVFLFTMLANCLPSLGLMDDKELLVNIIALGILIITVIVNVCIQFAAQVFFIDQVGMLMHIFFLHWPFSVALIVPASRRVLEHQYQELHRSELNHQEIKFFSKELLHHVKKYWMMAETGNPQFVLACSPFCSASGFLCSFLAFSILVSLFTDFDETFDYLSQGESDYKWSIFVIITIQMIGIVVGSIAPIFRCITTLSYFSISKELSMNNLNMFRVEKYWTQRLQQWKRSHVPSHIPGCHCKKVFHIVKNMILNCCLALQITVVFICKTICLIPRFFLILFSWCSYLCKSLLKRFKKESNASNNDVRLEMEAYTSYVLQIEEDAKLSKRILKNALNSINRILRESKKKQPIYLMKFLEKSTGFYGVVEFENDQVPPLHSEGTYNCWSLVVVTLTAIVIALPNIENGHVKGLLASVSEGLQFVRHIEECLNANGDFVKARKTARRLWTEVEVFYSWLQIDLQKNARKGKMSKEILQWLGDEAVKIVIQSKRCKTRSLDHSLHQFIAASSMYRISQTILLHCNEQEDWPTDEELFELISMIITDLLCACFTNLPRVITMKCHHKSIEKRGESIRSAAQLLGKSKKILEILEARQLPNIDLDSMAYIDKWHELLKSQIPTGRASSARIQPASTSSSSDESLIVTIM